ncbi:MAG: sigma-70 family RNA polymerase sigma factor [Gemmatimonadales bacterium]|nr:sigma-70 family RNA polymerase sigma factor [Gemmatimonadales bacterium]
MPPAQQTLSKDRFGSLLTGVLDQAYGYAMSLTRNRADAEDVLQEASLRALRFYDTFKPGSNFKAWFFRIVTNCYYESGRTKKRRPETVEFDDVPRLYMFAQSAGAGLFDSGDDPATALMAQLESEQITDALEALPEEYRVVSMLYFMEDFSYDQIAQVLECPVGTVRSRLHRGRRLLQKALWQTAVEFGIVEKLKGQEAPA